MRSLLLVVVLGLVAGFALLLFAGRDGNERDNGMIQDAGARAQIEGRELVAAETLVEKGREPVRGALPVGSESDRGQPAGASETAPAVTLVGRVLDEGWRPVAGATVELLVLSGVQSTVTGEDGRYRLQPEELPTRGNTSESLLATEGDRAGAGFLTLWPAEANREQDVEDIVLGPANSAVVEVRDGGLAVSEAEVVLECGFERLVVGRGRTDAAGRIEFPLVPLGSRHAHARLGSRFGRTSTRAEDPAARVLRIDLDATRAVEVAVHQAETGRPIAGARVTVEQRVMPPKTSVSMFDALVPEQRPLDVSPVTTDESGHAVLTRVPLERVVVCVEAEGYGERWRPRTEKRVEPGASAVAFELKGGTFRPLVRWYSVDGEVAVPADDTPLRLRENPGTRFASMPATGVVRGGEILVEHVPDGNWSAIAETPDGALAQLWLGAGEELGIETSFRRPRTIVARIEKAAGGPATGTRVQARDQGNNELCEPVLVDADGVATLTGLYGKLADVYVLVRDEGGMGTRIGSVDLEVGDGALTFALTEEGRVRLRILVDGEPLLPPKLMLVGNRRILSILSEDADRALVEARLARPAEQESVDLYVHALGLLTDKVVLTRADLDAATPIDVHLLRGGVLLVAVERPEGTPIELQAERESADGSFGFAGFGTLSYPNDDDGAFRFDALEPGRYRVRDKKSGLATDVVEVDPRLGARRVRLDLGLTLRVSGRVLAPEGTDLSLARVLVEGPELGVEAEWWAREPGFPGNAERVRADDGSFAVQVPLDRRVTLRAWHPVLRAAPEEGAVTIEGSGSDVVLRLEPGPTCSFDVPDRSRRGNSEGLHVLLFDGPVTCKPLAEFHAPVRDGRATFGGFTPGEYTLWVDPRDAWSPLVLEGIELGAGDNDLGAPAFAHGSRLRFRFQFEDGESAPRIFVSAERRDACPPLFRRLNSSGEEEVVLGGLAAGRYRVRWSGINSSGSKEKEVVLDGEQDEVIDVQL
jgi:hypothetical protein